VIKEKGPVNIIIDSGYTLSLIPTDMYTSLVSIVMESVNEEEPVKDPKGIFRLCYKNVEIK